MKRALPAIILALFLHACVIFDVQCASVLLSQEVEGNAVIKNNDVAQGREDAIQDALHTAIENTASGLIAIKVTDEKFLRIRKALFEQADKYIANYKIVSENKQPFIYTVNVNVSLAISVLKDDLKNTGYFSNQNEKSIPRICLIVRGLDSYSQYNNLKEFLLTRKNIVKNIYPENFEWQKAALNVEMTENVSTQKLTDELEKTGLYSINATQINNNIIEINLFR
ncbi:MAG TPA: hypothetical protein PKZ12_02940 [Smithellaceae bacterium]|nr:hypothetical protein [Smithellaceae bacterium]